MPLCANVECRQVFVQKKKSHRFCCVRCQHIVQAWKVKCHFCGTEFETKTKVKRFCGVSCARKYKRRQRLPERHCLYCGGRFKPLKINHIYCSRVCCHRGHYERNPEYAERVKAAARAHHKAAMADPVRHAAFLARKKRNRQQNIKAYRFMARVHQKRYKQKLMRVSADVP